MYQRRPSPCPFTASSNFSNSRFFSSSSDNFGEEVEIILFGSLKKVFKSSADWWKASVNQNLKTSLKPAAVKIVADSRNEWKS